MHPNPGPQTQSHGLPGKIHVSSASYERIMNKSNFEIKERGEIEVKGKGRMQVGLGIIHVNALLVRSV